MNRKYIKHELELIRSAAIKAEDDGVHHADADTLNWCLDYISHRVQVIRKELNRAN